MNYCIKVFTFVLWKFIHNLKQKKMSKDKGSKNIKKAPADKSQSNKKSSDYKSESKSGLGSQSNVDAFKTKPEPKTDKKKP